MLHALSANKHTFQPIEFSDGLNVILAERHDASDQKETRNGLGKSTLLEIIDFCLGGTIQKSKGIGVELLNDWEFSLEITVAGKRVKATRAIEHPTRIIIEGDTDGWIKQPEEDKKTGENVIHVEDWKKVLGLAFFHLRSAQSKDRYKPSFRSLISYFIRSGLDAYSDPFSHFRQQGRGDIQLQIAFLIGLNWENAAKWQELKDKEEALKALEKAMKAGLQKTAGELEAEKVRLETIFDKERTALGSYKVHDRFESIERKANRITKTIHEKTNENMMDRKKLYLYEEASATENAPEDNKLETIYKQSGLLFPEAVKKTLDEAKTFHNEVVQNRKAFLAIEIARLKRQLTERELEIRELSNSRAELLEILNTHGAFSEFVRQQEQHAVTAHQLENIKTKISEIRDISKQKKDIKAERIELSKRAEIDYEERRNHWEKAVRLFNEYSQALYNSSGRLVIDISDTGYKFDVAIQRSDSEGIGKMKLFCFDLMLSTLWTTEYNGIDFLIHDSIIYDGVDARQRALALELAAKETSAHGGQYICTLNSDMVPEGDFSKEFNFDSYVRLRLKDDSPEGSLLGIRF